MGARARFRGSGHVQLVVLSGWCSQWRAGVTGDVNSDQGVAFSALEARI